MNLVTEHVTPLIINTNNVIVTLPFVFTDWHSLRCLMHAYQNMTVDPAQEYNFVTCQYVVHDVDVQLYSFKGQKAT